MDEDSKTGRKHDPARFAWVLEHSGSIGDETGLALERSWDGEQIERKFDHMVQQKPLYKKRMQVSEDVVYKVTHHNSRENSSPMDLNLITTMLVTCILLIA